MAARLAIFDCGRPCRQKQLNSANPRIPCATKDNVTLAVEPQLRPFALPSRMSRRQWPGLGLASPRLAGRTRSFSKVQSRGFPSVDLAAPADDSRAWPSRKDIGPRPPGPGLRPMAEVGLGFTLQGPVQST